MSNIDKIADQLSEKLTVKQVRELLSDPDLQEGYKKEIKEDFVKALAHILVDADYDGDINYKDIKEFFYPPDEEFVPERLSGAEAQRAEPFFPERVPFDDYTEEEQQLKQARKEIDDRIREIQFMREINEGNIHESEDYINELEEYGRINAEEVKLRNERYHDKVDALMKRLYEKPFHTLVEFTDFNDYERQKLMPQLAEWYEDLMKKTPVTRKMWYKFRIGKEWRTKTLHDEDTRLLMKTIFNNSLVFNIDDIVGVDNLYKQFELPNLQLIDAFRITTEDKEAMRKHQKKQVNDMHDSGFFEYRLLYNKLEKFTSQLQIFTSLTDEEGKLRKELKYPCIVYAFKDVIDDEEILKKITNRIATDYLPIKSLRAICEEFSIQCDVRYVREDSGSLRKSNTKNSKIGNDDAKYKLSLVSFHNHYFVYKQIPLNLFYVRNYNYINYYAHKNNKSFEWCCAVARIRDGVPKIENAKAKCTTYDLVKTLFEVNAFTPYTYYEVDVQRSGFAHLISKGKEIEDLSYNQKTCTRRIEAPKTSEKKHFTFWYADSEACPENDGHMPFLFCLQSRDGTVKKSFWGLNCAKNFMEYLPDGAVVYFHNLGYDGRFLRKYGTISTIDKGTKIMKQVHEYNGKTIIFKDTLSMLSQPLATFPATFPKAFQGTDIKKELFPYNYYNKERVFTIRISGAVGRISDAGKDEKKPWGDEEYKTFNENIDMIGCRMKEITPELKELMRWNECPADFFDMRKYAEFYCEQDVNVLRLGYNEFRDATLQDPIKLDVDDFISAASMANEYMMQNVFRPNGNLFEVSGVVLDFLMGAVYGGRCMTRANKRYHINKILDDFDACSLYPSAMRRLWTVEGRPKVLTDGIMENILEHTFTENQTEPTKERYISAFVADIEITKIGIDREYPLIVKKDPKTGTNRNVNECCVMRVDNILLEDLIEFQKIEYKMLKGYYWTGKRDHRIRDAIKKLFDERAAKKKEGSSLQQTLKLIMNSSYGKSMQKPIKKDAKFIKKSKLNAYRVAHYYNYIEDSEIDDSDTAIVWTRRKLFTQFNNCLFGIQVLSMSKRIMNEVMCLAEDLGLDIYYQDTDSMHIVHEQVPILADAFREKYSRELIGENIMGCFHGDFDELKNNPVSVESYFLGKKTYIDKLVNDKGEEALHVRMKGIPSATVKTSPFGDDLMRLYDFLYNGGSQKFDLCKGRVQFAFTKSGKILNETNFTREVKATAF